MLDLTVIILTKDESLHIARCLENIRKIAKQVYVVDSFSTDGTQDIARSLGAEVVEHEWPGNQAEQFNWALENLQITSEWIMRIDADEYLLPELIDELKVKLPYIDKDINGIIFNRRHIFLDRWMKWGIYPVKMLRTFRRGHAECEQRLMDEHIVLTQGRTIDFENDFCDHNLNNISWFCKKHVDYAVREAAEMLDLEYGLSHAQYTNGVLSQQALEKRSKKLRYAKKPLFWRSAAYFLYRYILKGGWRDGKEGFIFAFIQGWWYRTLVDAKIYEIKKKCNDDPERIRQILVKEYGIKI
ncbi:MAG: glycosyltransferase family 2 protein [Bacteroides sp.]|nr:glycosyltransferase family 2 protein [Bacteroides sp.]